MNKWMAHVKSVQLKNPKMRLVDILKLAKKSYHKEVVK